MIKITDAAFPYLVAQQGRLDSLKGDRAAWSSAYRAKLARLLSEISPHLPAKCDRILDVGGGMGGIDALIAATYERPPVVALLDGIDCDPVCTRHARPFSNLAVAANFLCANGVRRVIGFNPDRASACQEPDFTEASFSGFGLICSFGSWCFHYPPAVYLPFVKASCFPGTVLIIEVRKSKPDWRAELSEAFGPPLVQSEAEKFVRCVYVAG